MIELVVSTILLVVIFLSICFATKEKPPVDAERGIFLPEADELHAEDVERSGLFCNNFLTFPDGSTVGEARAKLIEAFRPRASQLVLDESCFTVNGNAVEDNYILQPKDKFGVHISVKFTSAAETCSV